jgi:hypothetical protein
MFTHYRTKDAISGEKWDYVVLQVIPGKDRDDLDQIAGLARQTDAAIRKAGARTVFYVTNRARQYSRPLNPQTAAWGKFADELGALHAPQGQAWAIALDSMVGARLYDDDDNHPSKLGSYLTACVIFLAIAGDRTSCPAIESAGTPEDIALLQKAAVDAVLAAKRER